MKEKIKLEEIPEPVGKFILDQKDTTPIVTTNGWYWHYKDVVTLLTRYAAARHPGAVWPLFIVDNKGIKHEVNKVIYNPADPATGHEVHVWCHSWYGHHIIGMDCEWYSESCPSKEGNNAEQLTIDDYKEVMADRDRLVREIDVILNGDNAAKQASLCDLVEQIKELKGGKENEAVVGKSGLRETIEDIIYSAGKHSQEQCTEIADAILHESGQSKEGDKEREVEIIDAQNEYIQLLGDELNEVVGMVTARNGWKSTRVEQGKLLREKIEQLYEQYNQQKEGMK